MADDSSLDPRGSSDNYVGVLSMGRAVRAPEPALKYSYLRRRADARAGKRDGNADASVIRLRPPRNQAGAAEVPLSPAPRCVTAWLSLNVHMFVERDRNDFLAAQAAAAPLMARLQFLQSEIERGREAVVQLTLQRARVTARPTAEELEHRGPGERFDTEAALVSRRRREQQERLAAMDAQMAAARARVDALAAESDGIRAALQVAFETAVIRSERLRQYHERRSSTYLRAYLRILGRRRVEVTDVHPINATIPVPEWTISPCPWTLQRSAPVAAG